MKIEIKQDVWRTKKSLSCFWNTFVQVVIIYISLERQEKYVFCDIQNNQILRQPHKHACIYIQLYSSPPFFYLFREFLSKVTAGIHNLIIWHLNQELHLYLHFWYPQMLLATLNKKKVNISQNFVLFFFLLENFISMIYFCLIIIHLQIISQLTSSKSNQHFQSSK